MRLRVLAAFAFVALVVSCAASPLQLSQRSETPASTDMHTVHSAAADRRLLSDDDDKYNSSALATIAIIVALSTSCCCLCLLGVVMLESGDSREEGMSIGGLLTAFLSFTWDTFGFIMCWGAYDTVSAVDGVDAGILHGMLALSIIPSIFAFLGVCLGGVLIAADEDPGNECVLFLLMVSPMRAVVEFYYYDPSEQSEIARMKQLVSFCNWLTIEFPMGVLCCMVMTDHGSSTTLVFTAIIKLVGTCGMKLITLGLFLLLLSGCEYCCKDTDFETAPALPKKMSGKVKIHTGRELSGKKEAANPQAGDQSAASPSAMRPSSAPPPPLNVRALPSASELGPPPPTAV